MVQRGHTIKGRLIRNLMETHEATKYIEDLPIHMSSCTWNPARRLTHEACRATRFFILAHGSALKVRIINNHGLDNQG